MKSEKAFRSINELVAALANVSQELGSGTLQPNGLETACEDARELYERLVILRHKAREATVTRTTAADPVPAPNKLRETAPVVDTANEPPPLRLDTRPAPEPPSRQTSLIEAIEHTEKEQSVPVAQTNTSQTPSLAEKLEKAAVTDLNKAITLSHKFWFVAELFNGDRVAYDKGIEKLNSCNNVTDAMAYVQQEVIAKLKKPADPDALATFNELVQRRYA